MTLRMTRCPKCGRGKFRPGKLAHRFSVGNATFEGEVPAQVCTGCEEEFPARLAVVSLQIQAAHQLAGFGAAPESIRFMRSVLLLQSKTFAELVGVAPETVSRWEGGKRGIDGAAWALLCSMIRDKFAGTRTTLDAAIAAKEQRERPMPKRRFMLKKATP